MTSRISRRGFLVGAGALTLAAACGSDDTQGAGSTSATTTTEASGPTALAVFFDPNSTIVAGVEQRLPFGLVRDGYLVTDADAGPPTLDITIADEAGAEQTVSAERHATGLPRPYWRAGITFAGTGIHTATATLEGAPVDAALFNVNEADAVSVLAPGASLPPVDTPTVDDARGVTSICTRTVDGEPAPCPFHDVTLSGALGEGGPVAFLVSTPQFCTSAVCGPVLEFLIDAAPRHTDVRFLHAEVYVDGSADTPVPTAAMQAMGLAFEPSLFLADADGVIVDRLDFTWDATELDAGLSQLTG